MFLFFHIGWLPPLTMFVVWNTSRKKYILYIMYSVHIKRSLCNNYQYKVVWFCGSFCKLFYSITVCPELLYAFCVSFRSQDLLSSIYLCNYSYLYYILQLLNIYIFSLSITFGVLEGKKVWENKRLPWLRAHVVSFLSCLREECEVTLSYLSHHNTPSSTTTQGDQQQQQQHSHVQPNLHHLHYHHQERYLHNLYSTTTSNTITTTITSTTITTSIRLPLPHPSIHLLLHLPHHYFQPIVGNNSHFPLCH